jgi:hypothetical protein
MNGETPMSHEKLVGRLFVDKKIYVAFAAALLFTLPFQTLPIKIQIQTLPLTTVIAFLGLPFLLPRLPRSPLLTAVLLFGGFAFLHSGVFLIADLFAGESDIRFLAWLRQVFALSSGIIMFLVCRATFERLSDDRIMKYTIWGLLPSIALGLINVLWGTGQSWAGAIVLGVRGFFCPVGYTSPLRATGFTIEPAAFASSLVIFLLPAFLYRFGSSRVTFSGVAILAASILALTWTFSSSGFIILLGALGSGLWLGPKKRSILVIVVATLALLAIIVFLIPNNQIIRHAGVYISGQENVSANDRIYSAFGPFMRALSSRTMFGYGLGAIATHFREVVPDRMAAQMLLLKYKDFPSLAIMFGRVFAETGAAGLALFSLVLWTTFRELRHNIARARSEKERLFNTCVRLGMIAVCVAMFLTIGPYHTPYFWLWIAVIDSRYTKLNRNLSGPAESSTEESAGVA